MVDAITPNKLEFADIGNAFLKGTQARYYGQRANLEQGEEQRRQDAQPYIQKAMQGDNAAMASVAAGDPKTAAVLTQALGRLDAQKAAHIKGVADFTARAANAVLQASPAERPAIYQQMLQQGMAQGYDLSTMPSQYNPAIDGQLRFHRAQAIDINKQLDRDIRLQIHNTPGGGGGGGLEPMGGPPAAAPGVGPRADAGPAVPPTQFAQAQAPALPTAGQPTAAPVAPPQVAGVPGAASGSVTAEMPMPAQSSAPPGPFRQEGGTVGAPPVGGVAAPAAAKLHGRVMNEDPEQHGYVPAQDRKKPGQIVINDGYIHYVNPNNLKDIVAYKPQPEKPAERVQPQPGFRWMPGQEGQRQEFIPGGGADPDVITRAAESRRIAAEKAIPQTVTKGMQENVNSLKQLDRVDTALNAHADSVGGWGSWLSSWVPGAGDLQNRWGDPQGAKLRALIADIGSMKIHDRSGAAVTASEFPRLRPFIPSIADPPNIIRDKLSNFRAEYAGALQDATSYYGPDNGFRAYAPATDYLEGRTKGETTPSVSGAKPTGGAAPQAAPSNIPPPPPGFRIVQ